MKMWLLFSAKLNYTLFESIIYFKTHFSRHFSSSPSRRSFFWKITNKKKNRFLVLPPIRAYATVLYPLQYYLLSVYLYYTRRKLTERKRKNCTNSYNTYLHSYTSLQFFILRSPSHWLERRERETKCSWRIPADDNNIFKKVKKKNIAYTMHADKD